MGPLHTRKRTLSDEKKRQIGPRLSAPMISKRHVQSHRFPSALPGGVATAAAGCSNNSQHALTLIPPIADPCDPAREPGCKPTYDSCSRSASRP